MDQTLPSVFVIGSSTTLLMDAYLAQMARGQFAYSRKGREAELMGQALTDLDNPRGASAGDSSMVLSYLQSLEGTSFRPDLVLMHVGFHDIKRDAVTNQPQVPLEQFTRNVEAIVRWFATRHVGLVWMMAGPLNDTLHNARSPRILRFESDLAAYNAAALNILKRHSVEVLDLAAFTAGLGPLDELLKDHVHFKDDVVRLQVAYVVGFATGWLRR